MIHERLQSIYSPSRMIPFALLLIAPGLFLSAMEPEGAGKTMARTEDPVVIEGKNVAPLEGAEIPRLSLMACSDGTFHPIPFQVDEKDENGDYVFAVSIKGEKIEPLPKTDSDPSLDSNDELVFMVFDAGDRCAEGALPEGAERGVEIGITDPVDGGRTWAYLFTFSGGPPRSDRDYIRAVNDPARGVSRIEARNYVIENVDNAIYYNYLAIVGPDGKKSPDLVDRLKIRCTASIAFNTIKIPFAMDELIKTEKLAVTDGPIRVLSLGQGYMEGPAGIRLEAGKPSVVTHYPNFFVMPIHLKVPVDADVFLSDFALHGENDFNPNARGIHYYDAQNSYHPDIVFDGKMSEAEKNMDYGSDHDWMVLTGPHGTCVFRIVFPPEWDFINKGLYYKDDPGYNDPPEDDPGAMAAGFDMENFIDLKKGSFSYYFHYYFPRDFEVGDESRALNIMDRPLEVKARETRKIKGN